MKSNSEKNLYFGAIMLFLFLVLGGLNLVDANLTRLVLPDTPFATISRTYEHGLVLKVPEKQYNLPSLEIVTIAMEDGSLLFTRNGGGGVKVPRFLTWWNIKKLRGLLDVDKLMP